MAKLADLIEGRNNNLNLIRFIAASSVLLSHCFSVLTGNPLLEPLNARTGISLGMISVDVFFLISGFLVTESLLRRQSLIDFIFARVLRIYPALIAVVLITVFGLGVLFTTGSIHNYFSNKATWIYPFKIITMRFGPFEGLPGVFLENPLKGIVNTSLWTLPLEMKMYIILALMWFFWGLISNKRVQRMRVSIIILALCGFILFFGKYYFQPVFNNYSRFIYLFFTGAAWFIFNERIKLQTPVFIILISAVILSSIDHKIFFAVYYLAIPYLVFFLAYVPEGIIRNYNKLGDYSYGIYLFAFPVQQITALQFPGISILSMFLFSFPVTLIFAVLSWHIIEKRALLLKPAVLHIIKDSYSYKTYRKQFGGRIELSRIFSAINSRFSFILNWHKKSE